MTWEALELKGSLDIISETGNEKVEIMERSYCEGIVEQMARLKGLKNVSIHLSRPFKEDEISDSRGRLWVRTVIASRGERTILGLCSMYADKRLVVITSCCLYLASSYLSFSLQHNLYDLQPEFYQHPLPERNYPHQLPPHWVAPYDNSDNYLP